MAHSGTDGTRFTAAADILRQVEACCGTGAPVRFAWRKGWLAQDALVGSALVWPGARLRRIPGLRFKHLTGLFYDGRRRKPFEIATDAEAIQVDQTGSRLRLFRLKEQATLKAVRADTRYGPQTDREFALRREIAARTTLPVPQSAGREEKNGLIFVREQLIEGRIFNVRRDRGIFCAQIVDPLAKFYEEWGVTMTPLAEAVAPLAAFAAQGRLSPGTQAKLAPLLAANPPVAMSLSHNDVLSSNLAVGEKGVWFLDWGLAAPGLCGRDFLKTGRWYLDDAGVRGHIDDALSRLHRGRLGVDAMAAITAGYAEMNRETTVAP